MVRGAGWILLSLIRGQASGRQGARATCSVPRGGVRANSQFKDRDCGLVRKGRHVGDRRAVTFSPCWCAPSRQFAAAALAERSAVRVPSVDRSSPGTAAANLHVADLLIAVLADRFPAAVALVNRSGATAARAALSVEALLVALLTDRGSASFRPDMYLRHLSAARTSVQTRPQNPALGMDARQQPLSKRVQGRAVAHDHRGQVVQFLLVSLYRISQ